MIKIKGNLPFWKKVKILLQLEMESRKDKRFIRKNRKARRKAQEKFNRFKKLS